jgi:energy-coupling factor transport system substrate-specific component
MHRILNAAILTVASLIGLGSFVYPFFVPQQGGSFGAMAHAHDAPLVFVILVVLCLGAVLSSLSGGMMNAKLIAVLGILTAANAVLRGVPGPAGFTLVFLLPILCGYAFGPTFGFLLGVFSLAVSAFLGFGVGPWLPYQMFSAGWVGLLSGLLPRLQERPRAEVLMVASWGLVLGLVFGALMNVWFWPYVFSAGQSEMYWQPGLTFAETLRRYALFYAITSVWWDLLRSVGNFVLLLLLAAPVLRLLRRFEPRFCFTVG